MDKREESKAPKNPARSPGPSMQEILHREGSHVPLPLLLESNPSLSSDEIPYERYGAEYFNSEMKLLWPKVWQWACREEHIPEVGDYFVYDIGDYSILIVHAQDGIKAYINSCLHRGTKLKPSGSEGNTVDLSCPFHGWTWSLEGELKFLPCSWDLPDLHWEKFSLPQVQVGLWGGFVFINMDPDAKPLQDFLGVLPSHFKNWDLSQRFTELHLIKELPCNWKLAQEAFAESYHTMTTHPQLLTALGDTNTQYDVFGENVSRYYSASGVSSPNLATPLTEQEMLSNMFVGNRSSLDASLELKEGETARSVMADILRETLGKQYCVDLSHYSDTEMIDTIGYGVFPNTTFFAGISIPMVYRFKPEGIDPNRSTFEILFLRPSPASGEAPPPAEPFRIGIDESFTSVPGMDKYLAEVFDQDTNNLKLQMEGIKTSVKSGATLTNYQEIRIRHMHKTLEKYCG